MNYLAQAKNVFDIELAALKKVRSQLDGSFSAAVEITVETLRRRGKIIVVGIGKSGNIGQKIAATLTSTGSTSVVLNSVDALHGDLGIINDGDLILALSYSGESEELLNLLPAIKRFSVKIISITGNPKSSLAHQADVHLDASISSEACPLGLAPTASTTAALVMGDALAIALLEARGFTAEDFARSHPAGSLGRRLLLHISDIMHTGEGIPAVGPHASLTEALMEMTRKHLGMTAVIDAERQLLGVFTDGDLRRALDDEEVNLRGATVEALMTRGPKTITSDKLAIEAAQLMEKHQINALLVVDEQQRVVGALNIHDLLRARVV